jgi:hypothetical protein
MKKIACIRFLSFIIALGVLSASTFAQTPSPSAKEVLQRLPQSDALAYLNLRRILTEALPVILPEKSLTEMKAGIDQIKKMTGIDMYGIEHAVVVTRFDKLMPGPTMIPPDFLLVVRGAFNADSLLSLLRIGLQGKYTEEKYNSKTLTTLKFSDLMKAGDSKNTGPLPLGLTEVSVSALDGGTIAFGNPAYLKNAIDAEGGQGRINPDMVNGVMAEPDALINAVVSISPKLFNSIVPKEAQDNEEIGKLLAGIEQIYMSVGMNPTDFTLHLAVRMTTAEQASTLIGIAQMGISAMGSGSQDKTVQALLKALTISNEGNNVQLRTALPKDNVASLMRTMMTPPAKKEETASKATAKKPPQKRATGKKPVKKP